MLYWRTPPDLRTTATNSTSAPRPGGPDRSALARWRLGPPDPDRSTLRHQQFVTIVNDILTVNSYFTRLAAMAAPRTSQTLRRHTGACLKRIYPFDWDYADQHERLSAIRELRDLLDEQERRIVYDLRRNGRSWQQIADALGVKHRQQVQAKFHDAPPCPWKVRPEQFESYPEYYP